MPSMITAVLLVMVGVVSSYNIPDQDWGYVSIDAKYGANMFWWLYGAQNTQRDSLPLVVWLQGGPGGSSLFGDFMEFGPYDVDLQPRASTWSQFANLIFVDNPVGTGYSYVTNSKGFCTTDQEIADQLIIFLKSFLGKYPEFNDLPFWVYSESYGGKMTADFGVAIDNAISSGEISLKKFVGVGLGDGWVSPIDCMYSYSEYLLSTSLIDEVEAKNLSQYATLADQSLAAGDGKSATNYWSVQQTWGEIFTADVNWYNFLHYDDYLDEEPLDELLNSPDMKNQLGIPSNVTWGGQSNLVFDFMENDFMKPAITAVDTLLSKGYQVVIYSGQLDIIVDVLCTEAWINKLQWSELSAYQNSLRTTVMLNGTVNAYKKSHKNLSFWQILQAGHMVPADNPWMALSMFNQTMTYTKL